MDIFDFDIVKVEKANAMMRYRKLQHLTKLFRLGEVCLVLVFLGWISSRLPFVVKIAGEYFRLLLSIILTPLFIFLLGNVIVLTLLVKSGQLSGQSQAVDVDNADTELYEELLTSTEQMLSENSPLVPEPEEVVYQDKQMIFESNAKTTQNCDDNQAKLPAESVPDPKVFRRSQSEHLKAEFLEPEKQNSGKLLRRSETDVCRKVETPTKAVNVVDELSNEDFQRRIEGFIARQLKFHQEEKLAIVLHTR